MECFIMNVGDYVRDHIYGIGKIIKCYDNELEIIFKKSRIKTSVSSYFEFNLNKSSPQIIDLIEVGDYVNGWRVNKIERNEGNTGTIIKIGNSTFNVLDNEKIYTPVYENDSYYQKIEKLKTIITHEQMETMQYRVEE